MKPIILDKKKTSEGEDDPENYHKLKKELESLEDQINFIQMLSQQNLKTKEVITCLKYSAHQKTLQTEQELATQFETDFRERMNKNNDTFKDIRNMLKGILSVANVHNAAGLHLKKLENSFLFSCLDQKSKNENATYQDFTDQLLMTDDSNIVRKENLKLSPRDSIIVNLNIESNDPGFDDQISIPHNSNIVSEENHELSPQDSNIDNSNIASNGNLEKACQDLNDTDSWMLSVDESCVASSEHENSSSLNVDGDNKPLLEELNNENVADRTIPSYSSIPADQNVEEDIKMDVITTISKEQSSVFKKPLTPVFKRFFATPKEKDTKKSAVESQQMSLTIPLSPSFQSPKRSYPFGPASHESHSKMVTSSPKLFTGNFPSFHSPKLFHRRDPPPSSLYATSQSEDISANFNPPVFSTLNESAFTLNFGLQNISRKEHQPDVTEVKSSFFNFKSPNQMQSSELNFNSYAMKESLNDLLSRNDQSKVDDAKTSSFNFLLGTDLSMEEEETTDHFFRLDMK